MKTKRQKSPRLLAYRIAGGALLLLLAATLATLLADWLTGGIPLEDALINLLIRQNLSPLLFVFSQTLAQDTLHGVLAFAALLALLFAAAKGTGVLLGHRLPRPARAGLQLIGALVCTAALVLGLLITSSMLLNGYTTALFSDPGWTESALRAQQQRHDTLRDELLASGKDPTTALHEVMDAVESGELDLHALNDDDYIDLAERVCLLVDAKGGVSTPKEHYFRNNFDRAPATLDEMVNTICNTENEPFHWRLLPISSTLYHMIGPNGEYNLKFLSRDGHFEVVYNLAGQKLSTTVDPQNMGTFNYSSPVDDLAKHASYDVDPYLNWKNTPASPAIPDGLTEDAQRRFNANADAQKRYRYFANLCGG